MSEDVPQKDELANALRTLRLSEEENAALKKTLAAVTGELERLENDMRLSHERVVRLNDLALAKGAECKQYRTEVDKLERELGDVDGDMYVMQRLFAHMTKRHCKDVVRAVIDVALEGRDTA